eukprot:g1130.t1
MAEKGEMTETKPKTSEGEGGNLTLTEEVVKESKPKTILKEGAFRSNLTLTFFSIPEGVEEIPKCTFYGCKQLRAVGMSRGIRRIGAVAFRNCTSLTEFRAKEGLNEIGWRAFRNCSKLARVTLGTNVQHIKAEAFKSCSSLTEITLRSKIRMIGEKAFCKCRSLRRVRLEANSRRGLRIGNQAFQGCASLSELVVFGDICAVGERSFEGCTRLTSLMLPLFEAGGTYVPGDMYSFNRLKLTTLRLARPLGGILSIPAPPKYAVVRAINAEREKYNKERLFADVRIARTVYYILFIVKCVNIFVYNLDRYNTKKIGDISKRIFGYWFRGRWHRHMFPIYGFQAFLDCTKDIELDLSLENIDTFSYRRLSTECKKRGLKANGLKVDVIERLRSYLRKVLSEREDLAADKDTDAGEIMNTTTSTHLTRKETVSADFYMAEKSIDKILEWITIELLTHRPERPLLFLRDLFTKTSFEGVDVTDRKRVNNGGVEILRSQLETLNEELRSTNALTETNDDCEIKRDAIFEAGTTSLSDVVSSKSRDGAGVSATTGSSSPATPIGL